MVSRYERSVNSPYKKINKISDALNVSEYFLLEKHFPKQYSNIDHKVPLFMQIPISHKLNSNTTNYYYICPEWILKRDRECIAIDSSLINSEENEFNKNGVVYISKNIKPITNDYVLVRDSNGLIKERYKNTNCNILGKVLAQEIRY